jgi:hypothetical protein
VWKRGENLGVQTVLTFRNYGGTAFMNVVVESKRSGLRSGAVPTNTPRTLQTHIEEVIREGGEEKYNPIGLFPLNPLMTALEAT